MARFKNKTFKGIKAFNRYVTNGDFTEELICTNCIFEDECIFLYIRFHRLVEFVNCTFTSDLIFGDDKDERFGTVFRQDLRFNLCTFNGKVLLDGISCEGAVTFKDCIFEYNSESIEDFALGISSATIGIGLKIESCKLQGGLNLNGTKVYKTGCFIKDSTLINDNSGIDFVASFFEKELSISNCIIKCDSLSFNDASVGKQGHVSIMGKFIKSIDVKTILDEWLQTHLNLKSIIEIQEGNISCYLRERDNLLLVSVGNEEYSYPADKFDIDAPFNDANILKFDKKLFSRNDSPFFKADELQVPIAETWFADIENGGHFDFVLVGKTIYVFKSLSGNYILEDKIYIPSFYKHWIDVAENFDVKIKQNSSHLNYDYIETYDSSLFIIVYCTGGEWRIFKPTYISSNIVDFSYVNAGVDLTIRNSFIQSDFLDFKYIKSTVEVRFTDSAFKTPIINLNGVNCLGFLMLNNEFFITNYADDFCCPYDFEQIYGLRLCNSTICGDLIISDLNVVNDDSEKNVFFDIKQVKVANVLTLKSILISNDTSVGFELQDSVAKCLKTDAFYRNLNYFYLAGLKFGNCLINYNNEASSQLEIPQDISFLKNIINNHKIVNGTIRFLKQIELIYDSIDDRKNAERLWIFRNNIRIRNEHPKSAYFHQKWNEWFVDYGLSSWKLTCWLIGIMIIFDVAVYYMFDLNAITTIANGFIEFIPITFNSPVVESIRDEGLNNTLNDFTYGALVVIYRFVSYMLLSVLVTSLAGYFKGRNN